MSEPEIIPQPLAGGLRGPRGVAFDSDGNIWCVESAAGALVRIDATSRALARVEVGGAPHGVAIDAYDRVWFTDTAENAIRRYDAESRKMTTVAHEVYGQPLESPQELAFDARGQLIFTCLGRDPLSATGYVCCVQPGGAIDQVANELTSPTGLCVLHAGESVFIAESAAGRIWRGHWNEEDCFWTNESVWSAGLDDLPAAMVLGIDGRLYVSQRRGGHLLAINSEGLIVERIALPFSQAAGLAFDPTGQFGLVLADPRDGQLINIPGLGPGMSLFDAGAAWPL